MGAFGHWGPNPDWCLEAPFGSLEISWYVGSGLDPHSVPHSLEWSTLAVCGLVTLGPEGQLLRGPFLIDLHLLSFRCILWVAPSEEQFTRVHRDSHAGGNGRRGMFTPGEQIEVSCRFVETRPMLRSNWTKERRWLKIRG